ncbi:HEL142Cp [Eremothecium sinecaudum]|uniref:HEL142Cp n=1 Tax=Eremothecium sinecaudum TaxID=45286 RepID=A0A0X8HTG1_9SACH|nr:HEL142Cp [Eremothecium sinecaudum]AMD21139.1 HEL142Cp [Eremothecium sinecaudum]
MQDTVALELVGNDFPSVLEEYFSDKEQFLLFANEQDFDLDTCMTLCDTVGCLNEQLDSSETLRAISYDCLA